MNWMKVKVILIILFLIINLMLTGVLISQNYNPKPISEKIAGDVYEILSSKGITVEKNAINTQSGNAETADAYPISSESSRFFKNLIKNAEITESGTYIFNGSEIAIYDNLVHFESTDRAYTDAESYFSSVGLDFSNAEFMYKQKSDNGDVYRYNEIYDGYHIFGASAEVTVSGGVITSADAVWYEITENHSQNTKTISTSEALLEFAADKSRGNKPCTVSDISFGYSIDAGSATASVSQMIPCIRITTGIGSSFYYDARSPEQ